MTLPFETMHVPTRIRRLAALGLVAGAAYAAGLELSECDLKDEGGRLEVDALCGTLAVPLDPGDPDAEAIELFVAVVEASSEQATPDPLVVFADGPGAAATQFFVRAKRAFARILRDRDVVLVDQRGTGRSAPLRCDGSRYAALLAGGDARSAVDAGIACLDELKYDPRFFTTSAGVADLERVRAALGYEQLNLYGLSYGTRVAQHYLRRHPNRVRSVVLDGVLPPDLPLGPELAVASQTVLDALFARCAADDACGAAFPGLGRHFSALLDRLSTAPAELTLEHPRTGGAGGNGPEPLAVRPASSGCCSARLAARASFPCSSTPPMPATTAGWRPRRCSSARTGRHSSLRGSSTRCCAPRTPHSTVMRTPQPARTPSQAARWSTSWRGSAPTGRGGSWMTISVNRWPAVRPSSCSRASSTPLLRPTWRAGPLRG